jgi:predicted transcriptional regulator
MTVVVMEDSKIQKELIQKWLDELPKEIPLDKMEAFIEKLTVIHKIEQGKEDSRNGRLVANEEIMKMLDQWSK